MKLFTVQGLWTISILGALALLHNCTADAAEPEWWAVATLRSYHYDRGTQHNEKNYGLGVEYKSGGVWGASVGFYKNSYYKASVYAGPTYGLAQYGPMKLGACLCAVTGYSSAVTFVPLPLIAIEGKRMGVNIGVHPAMVGLQLKFKF